MRQLGLAVVWSNGGKGIHFDVVGGCWAMFGLLFFDQGREYCGTGEILGLVEAHCGVRIVLRLKPTRFNLGSYSSDCPPQGNAGSNLGLSLDAVARRCGRPIPGIGVDRFLRG